MKTAIFTYYNKAVESVFFDNIESLIRNSEPHAYSKIIICTEDALPKAIIAKLRRVMPIVRTYPNSLSQNLLDLAKGPMFVNPLLLSAFSQYDQTLTVFDSSIYVTSAITNSTFQNWFYQSHHGKISHQLFRITPNLQLYQSARSFMGSIKASEPDSLNVFSYFIINCQLLATKYIVPDKLIFSNPKQDDIIKLNRIIALSTINPAASPEKIREIIKTRADLLSSQKPKLLSTIISKFYNYIDQLSLPDDHEDDGQTYMPKNLIVEVPINDPTSAGISRMLRLAVELPHANSTAGGIIETLKLAKKIPTTTLVRFQRITGSYPIDLDLHWTVGLPDNTFPGCDACITYSDNPYLNQLVKLPQVDKVILYMLSYGMAIDRERVNVLNPDVTVTCSTKKLEEAISKEGVKVHRIGFGLDMDHMFVDSKIKRNKYLALLYHPNLDKRYDLGVKIANTLYSNGTIDGVITFGSSVNYDMHKHPVGLVKHYSNAKPADVRAIFNQAQCFLMPSITEGLNLTPIESTLCGCPAIICDGAINEIFYDTENCKIAKIDNESQMINLATDIIQNFDSYSDLFMKNMQNRVAENTWQNVITKLNALI